MQQAANTSSGRLILLIKSAYWGALLIIAAITMASYILLQQMMAAQQRDESLIDLIATQKALSQRVVFLANAATSARQERQPALLALLYSATAEFEQNYDLLLRRTGVDASSPKTSEPDSVEAIFFAGPHHLDHFSTGLAANSRRFISALETELAPEGEAPGYRAGMERAPLDEGVASATLAGFTALGQRIDAYATERLTSMLDMHRNLFYATIAAIVLVALFILRPMSEVIQRKTFDLVDARNSMAFIASHDGLTGLHNRTFLTGHLETLIKAAGRRQERLAVVQIDLDRFKQINDTLGHLAGDYVLVVTAQRLRESCRASDLCVRLGGDEFIIVLNCAGSMEDIRGIAQRVVTRINDPMIYQGGTILVGASAGIAVFPADADNARDLCVHADLALYSIKKLGGGSFAFFSEELRAELEHHQQMERDLRAAIAERSFDVHFQPQISLSKGAITGVEALVRWRNGEKGSIPPNEFIPVAEKCGLMSEIGRIVIAKAIVEAAEWHSAGIPFGRLAVNVSGTELRENDFDVFLFRTLARAGLPAARLSLEIVESVILDDEKTGIAAKLRNIRAEGVHLELDDFGTGYASLSHVNPNEIDRLKIDRRFVQNIDSNSDNAKIVRAITDLSLGLGIAIIAEGAETAAEVEALRSIGCDQVQGHAIARPMPAAQAREWMEARARRNPSHLKIVDQSYARSEPQR